MPEDKQFVAEILRMDVASGPRALQPPLTHSVLGVRTKAFAHSGRRPSALGRMFCTRLGKRFRRLRTAKPRFRFLVTE
jgi:hypothetical protein